MRKYMGLDWCLKNKPAMGKAADFHRLSEALDAAEDREEIQRLREELSAVSVTPAETLGAPRIGIDENATQWLRDMWEERHAEATGSEAHKIPNQHYARFWAQPFEEVLKEEHGKFVIDLVDYDKSTVTGFVLVGPTSFRGKVIGYSEVLPRSLKDEAYEDHDANEALDYGVRMQVALEEYFQSTYPEYADMDLNGFHNEIADLKAGVQAVEDANPGKREHPWAAHPDVEAFVADLPKHQRDLLEARLDFEGAAWLVFWGDRGHGFHAWY